MALRRKGRAGGHEMFPGFRDVVEIGIGSLAIVYRAREFDTGRLVALKLLNVRDASPRAIESFERESVALGSLSSHPNIVTLFRTFRTPDGRPVLVLELCTGAVADRLHGGVGLPVQDAVAIGVKIAAALETAHRAGILHRDVKPQNILVTEFGEPALADFGVAMLQSSTQTTAGLFDFTTLHAAPELLEGGGTSAATDVYELASSLYQLIAGKAAFRAYEGESPASVILRILRDPVRPLAGTRVPVQLSDLLIRAMSKDKDYRPPSAAEFAAELAEIESSQGWPRTQFLVRGQAGTAQGWVPDVKRLPEALPRAAPPPQPALPPDDGLVPRLEPIPEPEPVAQPGPVAEPEPISGTETVPIWLLQPAAPEPGPGAWTPPEPERTPEPKSAPAPPDPAPPEVAAPADPGPEPPPEPQPSRVPVDIFDDYALGFDVPGLNRADRPGAPPVAPAPLTVPEPPAAAELPAAAETSAMPGQLAAAEPPATAEPEPVFEPVRGEPPEPPSAVAPPERYPKPPTHPPPQGTREPSVPTWAVRAPAVHAPRAVAPQFVGDIAIDPNYLRPRLTVRSGLSSLTVDEQSLTMRSMLRKERLAWSEVTAFEQYFPEGEYGPHAQGVLRALTRQGPVELPATRRLGGELRHVHALLDAYRIRAQMYSNY